MAGFRLGQFAACQGMYGAACQLTAACRPSRWNWKRPCASGNAAPVEAAKLTRHEVDRHTLELVRQDLAAQQEEIAAPEDGVARSTAA